MEIESTNQGLLMATFHYFWSCSSNSSALTAKAHSLFYSKYFSLMSFFPSSSWTFCFYRSEFWQFLGCLEVSELIFSLKWLESKTLCLQSVFLIDGNDCVPIKKLRYKWHIIKFTPLKCTVQCCCFFFQYSLKVSQPSSLYNSRTFHHPQKKTYNCQQSFPIPTSL